MSGVNPPTIRLDQMAKEKWQPKTLTQKHKNIIALHVQGMKREDIGEFCKCTPEYVSMIIATPIAKEYLRDVEKYLDSRLHALYGKTVQVIEDGLSGAATDTQLKAARLQLEATNKLKHNEKDAQTAEDVVSALLKAASSGTVVIGQNVQINQGDHHGRDEV